jgi:aspartate aminotransferase
MKKSILIEAGVESIVMPDNLKVGLMVSEQRKQCFLSGCGDTIYGLAFGQSPFHVPETITRALAENAAKGHYSAAEGILELRQAVAEFNQRHFNLDADPDRVVIGPGTKTLIAIIFNIVKGDVIIPSPSWIGYYPQVKLLEKHFHTIYLKPEFQYKLQPDDLDRFLTGLHKEQHILVLNNPNNPTGVLYNPSELNQLADICNKHHTMVLADEIYGLTTYNIEDFTSMGTIYPEGTFVTNGLSKDRSAGGYRLGSCVLPLNCSDELIENFKKVAATVYTNVSTPTQYAAIQAYQPLPEIEEYFRITRQIHRIMGTFLSQEFNRIEGIRTTKPRGAFYFFADFNLLKDDLKKKGVKTSNELGAHLLSHPHHIAIVTGDACMLKSDDFGGRVAFVDYDGKTAYQQFKKNPPGNSSQEENFVHENAPLMVQAVEALKKYVEFIRE